MRFSTFLVFVAGACCCTELLANQALNNAANVGNALGAVLGGGGAMPWEGPMDKITGSISGPVARMVGVAAISLCGFGWAMGSNNQMLHTAAKVGTGLSVAFSAASWGLPLLGYGSGCLLI